MGRIQLDWRNGAVEHETGDKMNSKKLVFYSVINDLILASLTLIVVVVAPFNLLTRIGAIFGLIMVCLVFIRVNRVFKRGDGIVKPIYLLLANIVLVIMGGILSLDFIQPDSINLLLIHLIGAGMLAFGSVSIGMLLSGITNKESTGGSNHKGTTV